MSASVQIKRFPIWGNVYNLFPSHLLQLSDFFNNRSISPHRDRFKVRCSSLYDFKCKNTITFNKWDFYLTFIFASLNEKFRLFEIRYFNVLKYFEPFFSNRPEMNLLR